MIYPGRIFNGIERVNVEWHVAGWVVGPLSLVFAALAIVLFAVLGQFGTGWALVGVAIALVLWAIYVPLSNKINPGLRIKETTMLRILLSSIRKRHQSNGH